MQRSRPRQSLIETDLSHLKNSIMCNCNNQYVLHPELEMLLNEEHEYDFESPTSKPKFTRKSTLPDNCKDERDITTAFRQFINDAKALIPRITQPPVTKKIIDEIDH